MGWRSDGTLMRERGDFRSWFSVLRSSFFVLRFSARSCSVAIPLEKGTFAPTRYVAQKDFRA
jgi:hypothetical protein